MKYFHQHYVTWLSKEPYEFDIIFFPASAARGVVNEVKNSDFSGSTNVGAPLPLYTDFS